MLIYLVVPGVLTLSNPRITLFIYQFEFENFQKRYIIIPNVIYTGWLQQIFSEIISKLVFLKECGAARRHQKMLDTFWYLYMTFYWILDQFRSVQSTIIVNSYGARYRKSFLYTPQPVYLTLYIPSGKEKFLKISKNVIYTERYMNTLIWEPLYTVMFWRCI